MAAFETPFGETREYRVSAYVTTNRSQGLHACTVTASDVDEAIRTAEDQVEDSCLEHGATLHAFQIDEVWELGPVEVAS